MARMKKSSGKVHVARPQAGLPPVRGGSMAADILALDGEEAGVPPSSCGYEGWGAGEPAAATHGQSSRLNCAAPGKRRCPRHGISGSSPGSWPRGATTSRRMSGRSWRPSGGSGAWCCGRAQQHGRGNRRRASDARPIELCDTSFSNIFVVDPQPAAGQCCSSNMAGKIRRRRLAASSAVGHRQGTRWPGPPGRVHRQRRCRATASLRDRPRIHDAGRYSSSASRSRSRRAPSSPAAISR